LIYITSTGDINCLPLYLFEKQIYNYNKGSFLVQKPLKTIKYDTFISCYSMS